MYKIGKLSKEFNISRSTLLYYDSIGLLKPHKRTQKDYRLYTDNDRLKLEQIITYRQLGLPLQEIKKLLSYPANKSHSILENHLMRLSEEIRNLKQQQHAIVRILKNNSLRVKSGIMDKETWTSILRSSGMDESDMDRWHYEFEKYSPNAHKDFLISLGLNPQEIKYVRKLAQNYPINSK